MRRKRSWPQASLFDFSFPSLRSLAFFAGEKVHFTISLAYVWKSQICALPFLWNPLFTFWKSSQIYFVWSRVRISKLRFAFTFFVLAKKYCALFSQLWFVYCNMYSRRVVSIVLVVFLYLAWCSTRWRVCRTGPPRAAAKLYASVAGVLPRDSIFMKTALANIKSHQPAIASLPSWLRDFQAKTTKQQN